MRFFNLPGTSLRSSVIGLGTGIFGSALPRDDAFRMMDAFADAGGTYLDSAHIYAAWLPGGTGMSERTVGQWLKKSGHPMLVATKGGHPDLATMDIPRLTPECIARDIDESLERLQRETIDLYFLHRDNPAIPAAELLDALQAPLREGRVKAIGASNWSPARLREAMRAAATRGFTGFCCSQCHWSLAEANPVLQGHLGMFCIDDESTAFHRETRLPLFGYTAQAQGFFAQSWSWPGLANPTAKQEKLKAHYYSEKNVGRWKRATALGERHRCSANTIALAYLTNQSFPGCALVGPHTPEQLRDSLQAADLKLTPEEIAFLESDAPSPGGPEKHASPDAPDGAPGS